MLRISRGKSCGWMVKRCHLQAMGMERADGSVQDSFHWVWVVHPDREILQQTLASWKYFSLSCTVNPPPKRSEHLHLIVVSFQFRSQRWRVAFGLARLRWKKKFYAPGTSVTDRCPMACRCLNSHEENWEAPCNLKQQACWAVSPVASRDRYFPKVAFRKHWR